MKLRVIISLLLFTALSAMLMSAGNGPGPFNPTYLELKIPPGWPKPPTNIFAKNKLTEEGFQLGRKLFYDGRLSKDGNFPCASCHQLRREVNGQPVLFYKPTPVQCAQCHADQQGQSTK